jgi:hypothetical protein
MSLQYETQRFVKSANLFQKAFYVQVQTSYRYTVQGIKEIK